MTSCVLSSCFEPLHIYHGFYYTPPSMMYFSHRTSQHHEGVFNLLSEFMYDGEDKVAWPEYLEDFSVFLENVNEFYAEEVSLLLSYTLRETLQ